MFDFCLPWVIFFPSEYQSRSFIVTKSSSKICKSSWWAHRKTGNLHADEMNNQIIIGNLCSKKTSAPFLPLVKMTGKKLVDLWPAPILLGYESTFQIKEMNSSKNVEKIIVWSSDENQSVSADHHE